LKQRIEFVCLVLCWRSVKVFNVVVGDQFMVIEFAYLD